LNQAIIALWKIKKNIVGKTEGNIVGQVINRARAVFWSTMLVGEFVSNLLRKLAAKVPAKVGCYCRCQRSSG